MNKELYFLNKLFEKAEIGDLTIRTPDDKILKFQGSKKGVSADWIIKDWSVVMMCIKRGDIGLGESYVAGLWESSDLVSFLLYCSVNLHNIQNNGNGGFLERVLFYLYNNFVRMNHKYGSKKNISDHYDISNDFFKLWLDPTMTYSSAIRSNHNDSLEQAQRNKYHKIINTVDIKNRSVLEIGCGWGGFAAEAIENGADFTGITISDNQYAFAKQKLGNKAKILVKDYREINNRYDTIVSIEMFEAVGERYWSTYFSKIKESLNNGGRALIQTITINDFDFEQYKKNSDYIRHYVFPGGLLPSKKVFCKSVQDAGMTVGRIFEFGHDYTWTLKQWLNNFINAKNKLITMDYKDSFLRSWQFYFSICIAGFESGKTNVMQVEIIN